MMGKSFAQCAFLCLLLAVSIPSAFAEGQDESANDIAQKLSNPIASMISVPFQLNYDQNIGLDEGGEKVTFNIQPVIPFQLGDWKIISRTIAPLVWQDEVFPGENTDFGLGDITQSFFVTLPTEGIIVGIGPAFLLPTATEDALGGQKWGLGPTAVVVKQTGPWTMGALGNHIWDVAGDDDAADISRTFFQPFLAYQTKDAWTYTIQSESTYDWEANEASIPVNFVVSKIVKFGKLPVSIAGGVGYWADSPEDVGPEGWRFRTSLTFVFPE